MTGQYGRAPVGIVSDVVLQRHRLQAAAAKFGLEVCFSGDPERLQGQPGFPEAGLWLVTLEDEADHQALFDYLLENTEAPVLFGLDQAPASGSLEYFRWERRLLGKLERQLGERVEPTQLDSKASLEELAEQAPETDVTSELPQWLTPATPGSVAEEVWVLCASLGGPAAVKAFLDNLPPGLPIGFIYAQHIDGNFAEVLARVLGRHAHYKLKHAEENYRVKNGDVVLMPVEHEWTLESTGVLTELENPWPGPYGPSIDRVLLNTADHYGAHCHAILFSGMGNDGVIAAPLLKAYGSRIWVQESTSCGNSSMPDSVAATGCSSFTGTPEQLARELVKTIEKSCLLKGRQKRDTA
ncbi:MAG: chemotaxis protein CheB [Marinobacter sp.]|uniref:chemotaxis protein CheB n=1 Tax=Marinobacter sp. TaxID=50741 RepID=UPI001B48A3CD|nr:chemotaxis protein CheB [Marinobacter sp.]MBQ0746716.1 chemotaxis protein CheB [Marinobacter sp.]MBQ0814384.1 chemotaxis protein CheB [Marinobacter sp.]|tara:strand:- start:8794 stop:9855 length:1062 start_codon:yes stop_codon:yes gene_type:complete